MASTPDTVTAQLEAARQLSAKLESDAAAAKAVIVALEAKAAEEAKAATAVQQLNSQEKATQPEASTVTSGTPLTDSTKNPASSTSKQTKLISFSQKVAGWCSAASCATTKEEAVIAASEVKAVFIKALPIIGTEAQAQIAALKVILPLVMKDPAQLDAAMKGLEIANLAAVDLTLLGEITSINQLLALVQVNSKSAHDAGFIKTEDMDKVAAYVAVISGSATMLNEDPTIKALLSNSKVTGLNPVDLAKQVVDILTGVNKLLTDKNLVPASQVQSLNDGLTIANAVLTSLKVMKDVVNAPAPTEPAAASIILNP